MRPCGPELEVMCCKGGDRCYQQTVDGCYYIQTCTSVADGPCAYHGGPAVYFCGQSYAWGYTMRWYRSPATGWSCSNEGKTCALNARCVQGRWAVVP